MNLLLDRLPLSICTCHHHHHEATTTSPELETSTLVHPDFRQSVLDSGNGTFLGNVKQLNLSNMDSIRAFISKFYTNFTNP
ncbi:hypothetical protein BLOT_006964 [Blomia tropicalis]|nr:hypothetical protein BLOT_006964 [Blomia tropicalis]